MSEKVFFKMRSVGVINDSVYSYQKNFHDSLYSLVNETAGYVLTYVATIDYILSQFSDGTYVPLDKRDVPGKVVDNVPLENTNPILYYKHKFPGLRENNIYSCQKNVGDKYYTIIRETDNRVMCSVSEKEAIISYLVDGSYEVIPNREVPDEILNRNSNPVVLFRASGWSDVLSYQKSNKHKGCLIIRSDQGVITDEAHNEQTFMENILEGYYIIIGKQGT